MNKIEVKIYANAPVFVEADPDNFGKLFAHMSDEDQIHVLRSMVEHMRPHPIQWDYIMIALESPDNQEIVDALRRILPPGEPI